VPQVEDGSRALPLGPVDESRTLRSHDHVAGVKVAMAQPIPRRETLKQGKDARGEVLRKQVAGGAQQGPYQVAQGDYVRRRGRIVNGDGEGREDRARLLGRHGAGPQELQQGRSVEARQHDAEAPLQVTSSNTSGTGRPARVICASCRLSRCRPRAGLNSFTT